MLVVPAEQLPAARALIPPADAANVDVVTGGADRTASVARGLDLLRPEDGIVLVHDAARPLAPPALFGAVVAAVRQGHGAVIPAVPIPDTVKQVDPDGHVLATPDRSWLRAVQTPQGFIREILTHAHSRAVEVAQSAGASPSAGASQPAGASQSGGASQPAGPIATDDATLVERSGAPVFVIEGDPAAMKVTTAADLAFARWLVAETHRDEAAGSVTMGR